MTELASQPRLAYAFVERQVALMRRYWLWELVWVVYSITTSLAVAYIALAEPIISGEPADPAKTARFVLYLLVGTIAWRFLGIVFEDIAEIIAWERWEGTIEQTFMAPVPRVTHLVGMAVGTVIRAAVISVAVLFAVMLFIPVDLSHANALSAVALLGVGTLAFIGLGIASACFPLLWTEKGLQMSYIVQALVLLVSGVYYPTSVLPGWLQAVSTISPATYVIEGMRRALLEGHDVAMLWPLIWPALLAGAVSIPLGLRLFVMAERFAKRTGRLKRSG
ncbi:MAG: ABC transporter [Chloroflexi bacterium RIFCSPLOWO2_12_FULL_71_12]|nr:MAG: ABC transporter [Chloroflexi bacterium RIFCSPLOWO2_12_FULL_71_12]